MGFLLSFLSNWMWIALLAAVAALVAIGSYGLDPIGSYGFLDAFPCRVLALIAMGSWMYFPNSSASGNPILPTQRYFSNIGVECYGFLWVSIGSYEFLEVFPQ